MVPAPAALPLFYGVIHKGFQYQYQKITYILTYKYTVCIFGLNLFSMKKLTIFFLLMFLALLSHSQKYYDNTLFTLRAGFGYNLPVATGVLSTNYNNGAIDGIYGSWGSGFIPSLDFSVRIWGDFQALVGIGTLTGPEIRSSFVSVMENSSVDNSTKSKLWIPVLLTFGGRYDIRLWEEKEDDDNICRRFTPYMGFGIGIAIGTTVKNHSTIVQTTGFNTVITDIKSTITFKPALDLYGELGVKYKISKNLSVFLDARLSALALMPSKQKITSEIINGQDVTSDLTVSQRETDFVKNVPSTTGGQDEPSKELAEKFPASGISINCGISWNFGGNVLFGGPGPKIPPPVAPKPVNKGTTRDKIKVAAAVKTCMDCPPPDLTLISNNDDEDFPVENSRESSSGPWGKSGLSKTEILEHEAVCESCKGSEGTCCCMLKTLKVKLTFYIIYDTAALNKGVWLNTNKNSKEYGHTRKGKSLPEKMANKEDWKIADKKSVEVHERQHCSDMKDAANSIIEEALKKVPVDQCVCGENGDKACKEKMENFCEQLGKKLNDLLSKTMDKISESENSEYGKGDLEKKAREVQAEDLNNRPE